MKFPFTTSKGRAFVLSEPEFSPSDAGKFRDVFLAPRLFHDLKTELTLEGSFTSGYLEEVFGGLVSINGISKEKISRLLLLQSYDQELAFDAWRYIAEAPYRDYRDLSISHCVKAKEWDADLAPSFLSCYLVPALEQGKVRVDIDLPDIYHYSFFRGVFGGLGETYGEIYTSRVSFTNRVPNVVLKCEEWMREGEALFRLKEYNRCQA